MRNLYLVQPSFPAKPGYTDEYFLPYSVGVLWAAALQNSVIRENWNLAEIIFRREPIIDVIDRMIDPALVVFSCYVWNWEYNKKLAQSVKQRWPDCKIMFGGPQVSDKPFETLFLSKHPYVNIVCTGEGEILFPEILSAIIEQRPLKRIYKADRIQDLTALPSAYLSGVFDKIISDNPEIKWQAILETNRGCPYACTFCDWGGLNFSKIKKFDMARVLGEIQWLANHRITYLFIADANFGIFYERDMLIAKTIADLRAQTGYPEVVNATWQKNANVKNIEINRILGSKGFTVSAQSMNFDTLKAIKRDNMKINDAREIFEACERDNIATYTDLILGLPEETKLSWRKGMYDLLNLGQHNAIMVYSAQVLTNAELTQQIEQYDIKWIEQDFWASYYDSSMDPVKEFQRIVVSTNTMPFDDMVDSFVFSWMIFIFHSMGYTQVFARYLNNSEIMKYPEFYDKLWDFLKHDQGILGKELVRIRDSFKEFLITGYWNPPSNLGMKNLAGDLLRDSSLLLFVDDTAMVKTQLNYFFDQHIRVKFFTDLESYDQLKYLQELFTADFWREYPVNVKINTDVYNTVFSTNHASQFLNISVRLNSLLDTSNANTFKEIFFLKRKSSVAKTLLSLEHTCQPS